MRLKKLEIQGFKSFADKVEMEFRDGITGIVGPNGSGKSNVADAIRWVLGEQSVKSLRGSSMSDVIFGGTEKRRPLGYCEVTLLFDNTDGKLGEYSEVQVTRRMYRSGESEYFIGKTPCRLRDIVDMFRDTGIGREGYSMIGQGRVDEILSVRGEDRRAVFEEAAGIARFKARKTEAERRLTSAQDNMNRVQDILTELEGQLGPLRRQAENAQKYLTLQEEIRTLDMNAFLVEKDRLDVRLKMLEEHLQQRRDAAKEAEERLSSILAQRQDAEQKAQQNEEKVQKIRADVLSLTRSSQEKEGETALLTERLGHLKQEAERLLMEAENDRRLAEELAGTQTERQETAKTVAAELEGMRARQVEAEEEYRTLTGEIAKAEEEEQTWKDALLTHINARGNTASSLSRLSTMREVLEKNLSALANERSGYQTRIDSVRQRLEEAEAANREAREELARMQQEAERQHTKEAELRQTVTYWNGMLANAAAAQREAETRLNLLRTMAREYEGYQNPVRETLRHFRTRENVYGVVADLLVSPKQYEVAIETALGGQLQNIVCDREETAQEMIQYLREQRLGRATFLPLSALRVRTLSRQEEEVLGMDGCLGVAAELVSCEDRFRTVVDFLLGRTLVARDMTSGIAISRRVRQALRVVTLDGDVFNVGGSMTGGSQRARVASLLGRSREIAEHEEALRRLQEKQTEIEAKITESEGVYAGTVKEGREKAEQLREREIETARQAEREESLRAALQNILDTVQGNEEEQQRLRDGIQDTIQQEEELKKAQSQENLNEEEAQNQVALLSEKLHALRVTQEDRLAKLTEIREKSAYTQAQLQALEDEETRRVERLEQLKKGEAEREARREENRKSASAVEKDLEEAVRAAEQEKGKLSALQEELTRGEGLLASLLSDVRSLQDTYAYEQTSVMQEAEQTHRVEMQQSRLQSEEESLHTRLWDQYQATYADALKKKDPEFSLEEATPRINTLRRQIRAIGSVNVNAPEEYQKVHDRYLDFSTQKEDLDKAMDNLTRIIGQLDRQMEKQFLENFRLINDNFQKTFRRLFGGGTAMLRLQDEDNVLTCGIDIVAQPPGKKLQLLSLLSGGERALSAIAILFAILSIRPSPFCVLDEIEAALDDANIDNFGAYLKEYAKDTQFIVITHRKGTMLYCDSLYGVSMAEKGVSRMISVRMDEAQQMAEEEDA
ncbi:MAG: chromosome segregation protein SMC [Clostridia bacterium]|nr:chromosome segregation protein SMC [Clostridia bacterium]